MVFSSYKYKSYKYLSCPIMDSLETVLGLGFKVNVPTYLFSFKLFSKPAELFTIDCPFDLVKQP